MRKVKVILTKVKVIDEAQTHSGFALCTIVHIDNDGRV